MKRQLDNLTALRGIAALSVAAFHFHTDLNNKHLLGADSALNADTFFLSKSYLFVDFFFILSGFILYYSYKQLFSAKVSREHLLCFLGRRIGRLYPLHIAVLTAWILFECSKLFIHTSSEAFSPPNSIRNLVSSFLLVQAWIPSGIGWNTPSWSISAEWFVNILFPWLTLAVARLRRPGAYVALLVLLSMLAYYCRYIDPVAQLSANEDHPLLRCLVEFSAGLCIGRIAETTLLLEGGKIRALLLSPVPAATIVVLAIFSLHFGLNDSVSVFAFAASILIISMGARKLPIFGSDVLVWLGERSYSIYLVHRMLCIIGAAIVDRSISGRTLSNWETLLCFGGVLLASVAVSIFTYRWIEVPARYAFYRALNFAPGAAEGQTPASQLMK